MRGIVGTAGHIDHGKTALVGALTGVDTDRLPEERLRGISIDLGFTRLVAGDRDLGIVDVPGHEDFIRNMLAGATGIDLLLLVVAADEGVMPQTREHVAIAELLGVRDAVVALTKIDLVDEAWLELARDDVAGFLAGTPFADAPVVPTSAATGEGIDALRAAIERSFTGGRGRADDLFRLPVDRTFTVRGTGTVVTGTVWSGRLERDAAVRLLPGGPDARVRGLQAHGEEVAAVEAGQRAAVALAGIDRDDVARGMTVVTDPAWRQTGMLTVATRVLPGSRWSIEQRQRLRVHLGTGEVMARAVLLDRDRLDPGERGWAQLRLERPLLARAGDRLVLRSYSPVTTIGGGVVAEPVAPRRTRLGPDHRRHLDALVGGSAADRVASLLHAAGGHGLDGGALPILTGAPPGEVERALEARDAVRVGEDVFDPGILAGLRERLVGAVERYHRDRPLRPGMDPAQLRRSAPGTDPGLVERVLDGLLDEGVLRMLAGRVAREGFSPTLSPGQRVVRDRVLTALEAAGPAPPRLPELAEALDDPDGLEDIVALLDADGRLVRLEHDLYIDAGALAEVTGAVRRRLGGRSGLSPGDFREIVDVSRRHLIPILEHLDRSGVTARDRDGRTVPDAT